MAKQKPKQEPVETPKPDWKAGILRALSVLLHVEDVLKPADVRDTIPVDDLEEIQAFVDLNDRLSERGRKETAKAYDAALEAELRGKPFSREVEELKRPPERVVAHEFASKLFPDFDVSWASWELRYNFHLDLIKGFVRELDLTIARHLESGPMPTRTFNPSQFEKEQDRKTRDELYEVLRKIRSKCDGSDPYAPEVLEGVGRAYELVAAKEQRPITEPAFVLPAEFKGQFHLRNVAAENANGNRPRYALIAPIEPLPKGHPLKGLLPDEYIDVSLGADGNGGGKTVPGVMLGWAAMVGVNRPFHEVHREARELGVDLTAHDADGTFNDSVRKDLLYSDLNRAIDQEREKVPWKGDREDIENRIHHLTKLRDHCDTNPVPQPLPFYSVDTVRKLTRVFCRRLDGVGVNFAQVATDLARLQLPPDWTWKERVLHTLRVHKDLSKFLPSPPADVPLPELLLVRSVLVAECDPSPASDAASRLVYRCLNWSQNLKLRESLEAVLYDITNRLEKLRAEGLKSAVRHFQQKQVAGVS
jgi:hypothetical protein